MSIGSCILWLSPIGRGFVSNGKALVTLNEPPLLPFEFESLHYWGGGDGGIDSGARTWHGKMEHLTPLQMSLCGDWVIDAYDGGLAGS